MEKEFHEWAESYIMHTEHNCRIRLIGDYNTIVKVVKQYMHNSGDNDIFLYSGTTGQCAAHIWDWKAQ